MIYKPLISIITTVRNGEIFIKETLESVKNQIYRPIEHIIVDDGSEDATIAIIESYKKQNLDYALELFQPNLQDRGKALNYAVSKARAEWIAIIDADDLWHPAKLQQQYECVKSKAIDVLATNSDIFTDSQKIKYEHWGNTVNCFPLAIKDLLKTNVISHSSVLIKRDLCHYDEKRKSQYDYELWLRLACQGCTIASINQKYTFHRIHTGQFFESRMGKKYRWKSFLLQVKYAFKKRNGKMLPYFIMKFFLYDMLLPRKLRLNIRNRYKNF